MIAQQDGVMSKVVGWVLAVGGLAFLCIVWSLAADNREPLSATIPAGSDRGPAISAGWNGLRSTELPHASEAEPPTVVVIAPHSEPVRPTANKPFGPRQNRDRA